MSSDVRDAKLFTMFCAFGVIVVVVGIAYLFWAEAPFTKTTSQLEKALEEVKSNENPEEGSVEELNRQDGWDKNLRGEIKVTSEIVTYTARSAGPDGEFNTDDDMVAKYEKKYRARMAARWMTEGLKGAAGGVYEGIVGPDDGLCDYCGKVKADKVCGAESVDGFECSREEGHDGAHVACTEEEHEVKEWKDPSDKPFWKVW